MWKGIRQDNIITRTYVGGLARGVINTSAATGCVLSKRGRADDPSMGGAEGQAPGRKAKLDIGVHSLH